MFVVDNRVAQNPLIWENRLTLLPQSYLWTLNNFWV